MVFIGSCCVARAEDSQIGTAEPETRTDSVAASFTPLGPPTLEQLDRIFPQSSKTAKRSAPRKPAPDTDEGSASDLLLQMLQSADPAIRVRAVEGLSGASGKDVAPLLLIALTDVDVYVRDAAARSLGTIPEDALVGSIVSALGWGDPAVARSVDAALPELRNTLEGPMLKRFESKESPRVERMATAYCLGRIGSMRAGPALANEVWGDDLTLALYCADALASIDNPALLNEYVRMAAHPQVQMRMAAYRGLARIGGDDARKALIEAASGRAEPDTSARKEVLRLLAYVPNDEVVEFLMDQVRANAGLVASSTDALALMFGMPAGLQRERWLEWYREVYEPTKQSGAPPPTARASTDAGSGTPVGFPESGFPFDP